MSDLVIYGDIEFIGNLTPEEGLGNPFKPYHGGGGVWERAVKLRLSGVDYVDESATIDTSTISEAALRRRDHLLFTYRDFPRSCWPEGVADEIRSIEAGKWNG